MDKKVVFLDVDGTMVNEKGEIPESAQYAVRTAQANGHRMVVCSGRSRFQIYDALLELGYQKTKITLATLGNDAGFYGAAKQVL